MAQKNYPDIQVREGDSIVTNSTLGFKAIRKFKVTGADMTDPTSTIYSIIQGFDWDPASPLSDIPNRMTPHPTIVITSDWGDYYATTASLFNVNNCFCADVIKIIAISSTQCEVEVEYAVLNAMTQVASPAGDIAPALLEMGSSVQSVAISQDVFGQPLTVPYYKTGSVAGTYKIYPNGDGTTEDKQPTVKVTSDVQFPCFSFRFKRREQAPCNPNIYVGFLNSSSWTINGHTYPQHTILCTRIENQTDDGGLSYIVTYEFLEKDYIPVPTGSNFVSPAVDEGSDDASAWDLIAYYVLPSGFATDGTHTIGPNSMPPDAIPSIFAVYNDIDFNSFLSLTP